MNATSSAYRVVIVFYNNTWRVTLWWGLAYQWGINSQNQFEVNELVRNLKTKFPQARFVGEEVL